MVSEAELLEKILHYGRKGMGELFEHYYIPLVFFATSYVKDQEVAKDVVQDVFFKMMEAHERFNSIDNLKTYLYTAVRNKCLKYLRHENVKEKYEQYMVGTEESTDFYFTHLLDEEVFVLLRQAVEELPEQCRKVFLLALEGKGNAEISEQLGIGIETVKSHKKAGKKLLYKRLKGAVLSLILVFYDKNTF